MFLSKLYLTHFFTPGTPKPSSTRRRKTQNTRSSFQHVHATGSSSQSVHVTGSSSQPVEATGFSSDPKPHAKKP